MSLHKQYILVFEKPLCFAAAFSVSYTVRKIFCYYSSKKNLRQAELPEIFLFQLFRVIHYAAFPYNIYFYLTRIFKLVFDTGRNIVSHKHHLVV